MAVILGFESRWISEVELGTSTMCLSTHATMSFGSGRRESAQVVMTPASTSDVLGVVRGSPLSAYGDIRVNRKEAVDSV